MLRPPPARLPARLHVLAMDQRGHGGASKPATDYALASLAGVFQRWVPGPASGSHRTGPGLRTGAGGAPRSLQHRPAFADDAEQLTDPLDPTWVADSIAWFPRFQDVPQDYLADRVRDGLAAPAYVWQHALQGLIEAVPPTEAGTIVAPTLVIHGGKHDVLGRDGGADLAAAIPSATLLVYRDGGHLVLWEEPERLAADITDFIDRLPQ